VKLVEERRIVARESEARDLGTRSGRSSSFEALYREHAPGLRLRCRRLTRDPSAADDLMQEVFARFLARFPEPPPDMNVRAYLHATARNILWKQLRDDREVADEHIVVSAGADEQLERDPERSALLAEQRSLVQRCAALLSGRQRRALALREVDGRSYAEIGSELEIGEEAVGQVITRARARLRSALRREQIDLAQLPADCRALLGALSDYVDGHASEGTLEFERHLAGCDACRATLAAYQEAGSRLRGAAPLAPLATLLARIGGAVSGGDRPIGVGALASVAAAAVVAVGGGGIVLAQHVSAGRAASDPTQVVHVNRSATRSARTDDRRRSTSVATTTRVSGSLALSGSGRAQTPPQGTFAPRRPPRSSPHRRITSAPAATAPTTTSPLPPVTPTSPAVAPTHPTSTPGLGVPPLTKTTTPPVSSSPASDIPVVKKLVTAIGSTADRLATPAVSVPGVTTPSITTLVVSVPPVVVPPISTPSIPTPVGTVPSVTTPVVSVPSVTVPPLTVPGLSTPPIAIPPIKLKVP
jgi:RNA polymerase sigma factor (sigma-70 family)